MYRFSKRSLENLATCDEQIQLILRQAIQRIDFAVICGHRNKDDQEKAFLSGNSQLHFPQSAHNDFPSMAVDIAPYPIDWENIRRFKVLKKIIFEEAEKLGIDLVWGGDWSFRDYPHYQL